MTSTKQSPDSGLPVTVDAARMLTERRVFEGTLAVARLPRLLQDLANDAGQVRFYLEFERGELGGGQLHVRATTEVQLECQRTLEIFAYPIEVDTRLGLIDNEHLEDGLPRGIEPLLLDEGTLRPAAVIEDELLLALPLIPVKPGSEMPDHGSGEEPAAEATAQDNPFAVLGKLKQDK